MNGRIAKNAASVILTANAIKAHIGLELSIEERRHEAVLVEDAQVDEDKMQGDERAATAA